MWSVTVRIRSYVSCIYYNHQCSFMSIVNDSIFLFWFTLMKLTGLFFDKLDISPSYTVHQHLIFLHFRLEDLVTSVRAKVEMYERKNSLSDYSTSESSSNLPQNGHVGNGHAKVCLPSLSLL